MVATFACFGFLVTYAFTAKWWRNPIGRLVMIQSIAFSLVLAKSAISLALGASLNPTVTNVSINLAVGALFVYQLLTYLHVLRVSRNARQK